MNARVYCDQYGIELTTDFKTRNHAISMETIDDVKEIVRACEEFMVSEKSIFSLKNDGTHDKIKHVTTVVKIKTINLKGSVATTYRNKKV